MILKTPQRKNLLKAIERFNFPFFLYNLDDFENHLQYMNSFMKDGLKLWYAVKANPHSALLKICRNQNIGLDVASFGECQHALGIGLEAKDIIATGPAKSKIYLSKLLDLGVQTFVIESYNQLHWLHELALKKNKKPKVLIRVQLSWDGPQDILGGAEITPFGLSPEAWSKLKPKDYPGLYFIGFHAFQWGNILEKDRLLSLWAHTLTELKKLSNKTNIPLEVVDLGGGLGIPYDHNSVPLQFSDLIPPLQKFKKDFGLSQIWLELGRYAAGPYGYYANKVIDRKAVRGQELLIMEGGINHLARPALTGQSFPCELFRKSEAPHRRYSVHGPLCTAMDKLGVFDLPGDIAPGDWLVFSQTGAYGLTESMPFFLCHSLPGEAIMYKNHLMTPRSVKSSADWLI
jgi:diaminopimelate decarboxylase